MARHYYPLLVMESNAFGRLELDYETIRREVLSLFAQELDEAAFWNLTAEYRKANLIFLYKSHGQIWGQWDIKKDCLPKYQSRRDKNSPIPPEPAFAKWIEVVRDESKDVSEVLEEIPQITKKCKKVLEFPALVEEEKSCVVERVVGVLEKAPHAPNNKEAARAIAGQIEEAWAAPDVVQIAEDLVRDIHPNHPEFSDRNRAVMAAAKELAGCLNPVEQADIMRTTHHEHCAEWNAKRRRDPGAWVPFLDAWFSSGMYAQKMPARASPVRDVPPPDTRPLSEVFLR